MTSQVIQKISDLNRYLVGGAVRDRLLNVEGGDKDWVVVGASEDIMLSLGFRPVGKDFPVFLHPDSQEEHALARTERKVGKGYRGFEVNTSQSVTLERDLYRRDLTINAMALDADGCLIDPFGGQQDLKNGVLRHVSEHFVEDPLRVLRVARFAARFFVRGFLIDESTLKLMGAISKSGELDHLVAERVWQELQSALSERHPSVFFKVLEACDALESLFPETTKLIRQATESDTGVEILDVAAGLTDDIVLRFTVLAYLIGKIGENGRFDRPDGHIVTNFCDRLRTPAHIRKIAQRVSRYTDEVMTFEKGPASAAVDLVLSLEGLRNKALFDQFLEASSVILMAVHQNCERVRDSVELLRNCRAQMHQTDIKPLAAKFKNNQLRESIRAAYIERVSELL